jgi:hypothetical protein
VFKTKQNKKRGKYKAKTYMRALKVVILAIITDDLGPIAAAVQVVILRRGEDPLDALPAW